MTQRVAGSEWRGEWPLINEWIRDHPRDGQAAIRLGIARFDPLTWAGKTAKISLKTGPLNFDQHPFLIEPYRDVADELIFLKGAQLGFCLSEDSELLSRRGWLSYDQVEVGEDILTFDPKTGTTRWSPVEHLYVDQMYDGPMVHIENRSIDALVTANHRWLVRHHTNPYGHKFRETKDLKGSDTIPTRAPHAGFPSPTYHDDVVELVGWVITEGTYGSRGGTKIVIGQNPGPHADAIRSVLHRIAPVNRNGTTGGTESMKRDGTHLFFGFSGPVATRIRELFPTKELTAEFVTALSARQCRILYEAMMAGDGHVIPLSSTSPNHTTPMFYQKSKQTTDAFALLCVLLGYCPRVVHRTRGPAPKGSRDVEIYEIHIKTQERRVHVAKTRRSREDYRGVVWCPTTRDGTFVMRRNGKVVVTGNSTLAIIRMLWLCTTFPISVIFTLPTLSAVSDFAQSRINPMILDSEFLRERIVDVNTVSQKQFSRIPKEHYLSMRRGENVDHSQMGVSTAYFSGTGSEAQATMRDADVLIHDEEDKSNARVIEMYESRLGGPSNFRWKMRLSTPTIANYGIDRQWKRSDQRHWHNRCSGCGKDYELSFPGGPNPWSNVEPETYDEIARLGVEARYKCHHCGKTITVEDRLKGFWVTYEPGNSPHGYKVTRMAAPWVSAGDILLARKRQTFEYQFWNMDMATPWAQGATAFDRQSIIARSDPESPMAVSGDGCYMGVDVGLFLDVVVDRVDGDTVRTIKIARLRDWDDLDRFMRLYDVKMVVIDALPEIHKTNEWVAKWGERAWRSYYSGSTKNPEPQWNAEQRTVTTHRTSILDLHAEELLKRIALPRYDGSEEWEAYITHHTNAQRVTIFQPGAESLGLIHHFDWVETGPDHLFHAATYAMLARSAPGSYALPTLGLYTTSRAGNWARENPSPVPGDDEQLGLTRPSWRRNRMG